MGGNYMNELLAIKWEIININSLIEEMSLSDNNLVLENFDFVYDDIIYILKILDDLIDDKVEFMKNMTYIGNGINE